MKVVGYCEYGYKLFSDDCGRVQRLPIPYVFTRFGEYWWRGLRKR